MKSHTSKGKHLTADDRSFIEASLNSNLSFKNIALSLGKDPTTISKEIKSRSITKHPLYFGKSRNICLHKKDCFGSLCSIKYKCNKSCFQCSHCNSLCSNFHYLECELLLKPPYVCNPCSSKKGCQKMKRIYSAFISHTEYQKALSTSRQGINLSQIDFNIIDAFVSNLIINNGLSINHIITNNKDTVKLSQRTIYRYFDKGILSASPLDLPRKLAFKPRKNDKDNTPKDYAYLEGRRYHNFLEYTKSNPNKEVIEMDCVEGTIGTSVFLTMVFKNSGLLLLFKLEHKNSKAINKAIKNLITYVGKTRFKKYFPIILTDRGAEFRALHEVEFDRDGNRITNVFYCDPGRSDQKGTLEQAHTNIRKVYPKGNCLDNVSHKDTRDLMNNINNYSRKSLNGKTPLDVFIEQKPIKFITALNQKKIAPNKVCLRAKMPKKLK